MPAITVPNPLNGINYNAYGGYADLDFVALGGQYATPPHSFGAGFRLGTVGPQWCFVDPLGKVFVFRGLFGLDKALHNAPLGGGNQAGRSIVTNVSAKYPTPGTTWEEATKAKMKLCHYNVTGPFSIGNTSDAFLSHKSPSLSCRRKDRSFADYGLADPVKDIARCMVSNPPGNSELFYRPSTASSVGWADWLDPKWKTVCNISFGPSLFAIFTGQVGLAFEESDYMSRWMAGGHPNERSGALSSATFVERMGIHAGIGILFSRLSVTTAQDVQNVTVTFTDTINYSKAKLIQNLKDKYGNSIATLNNAWQTGGYYTSFDSAGGFGIGTGVADEDGLRPRMWFGQHSPVHLGHPANTNNVVDSTTWGGAYPSPGTGTPNLVNEVKRDLDQIMVESVEAWVRGPWDVVKARDPGILFSPINNAHFTPHRPVLAPVWSQYTDFFAGTVLNGRSGQPGSFTIAEATDAFNWTYALIPKPGIANFYMPPAREDSCLYYVGAQGYGNNILFGQIQNDHMSTVVYPFAASGSGHRPVLGWMKWEYFDNTSEGIHWGICSLNDNLYDGRNYTTQQADPYTTDRQIRTEDNPYTDMLGFGGTNPPVLQRTDLLIGANIALKALFEQATGAPATPLMLADVGAFVLGGRSVSTVTTLPNTVTAEVGAFALGGNIVGTAVGALSDAFTDNFNRADTTNLGSNWEEIANADGSVGDLRIVNNNVLPTFGNIDCRIRRTTDEGSFHHYAQLQVLVGGQLPVGVTARLRLNVRGTATDLACYEAGYDRDMTGIYSAGIWRRDATGLRTSLTSATDLGTPANATLRFEAEGSTLTLRLNGAVMLTTTDAAITAGQRTGFLIRSGTNSTSDFMADDYQSGTLVTALAVSMAVGTGAIVLSGQTVATNFFVSFMSAGTGAFSLAGQAVTTTLPAQGLLAGVGSVSLVGRDVLLIQSFVQDPNIPMIRILSYRPGAVAILIVRASVLTNQQFFYADPNTVSLHPNASTDERDALRNGLIVERKVSVTAPLTFEELKLAALAAQQGFQDEMNSSNVSGMSGLYGVNTRFTGTVWV